VTGLFVPELISGLLIGFAFVHELVGGTDVTSPFASKVVFGLLVSFFLEFLRGIDVIGLLRRQSCVCS